MSPESANQLVRLPSTSITGEARLGYALSRAPTLIDRRHNSNGVRRTHAAVRWGPAGVSLTSAGRCRPDWLCCSLGRLQPIAGADGQKGVVYG